MNYYTPYLNACRFSLPLFFFLLSATMLMAQSQDSNPLKFDVIPPAPDAAALGKFVDNPVSAYTGVPKIDIPIYTLKSHELSLPISLSYHASGIKWEEIPSWVGAGWTLNAGGIVSRTIRGRNDEDPNYGYFLTHASAGYNIPSFFSGGAFSNANFNFVSPNCGIYDPPTDQYRNVLYASKGGLDLEPDQFFFSLPDGQSGKFMFSRSQQMRLIPHQAATITHTAHPTTGKLFDKWMIVGKDGTKYFFEKQETTISNTPCKELFNGTPETFTIPDVDAVSSWKLVRMENSSGSDYINFEYLAETYSYETRLSTTTYDRVSGELGPPGSNDCKNETTVNGWRLWKITTSAGYRVEFVANTNRNDLAGSKRLDRIMIYYNTTFLKRFEFTYTGAIMTIASVQEFFHDTLNTDKLPSYEFTYYTEITNTPTYSRTSKSLDHWGYYNAAQNNDFFSPPVVHDNVYYNGVNRKPELEACRWMTLKQIRYPTGGTVNYEYELNDFSNVPASLDFDHLSQLELIESVEFIVTNTAKPMAYQTKPFTLTQDGPVVLLFEIPATPGGTIPATGLHATLSKSSGAPFTTMLFKSGDSQAVSSPIYNFTSGNYTLYGEFQDGIYALGNQKFYVKVYRFKNMEALIQAGQMKGGGLRIKKIVSTGDNTFTKTYSYTASSTGLSSGKLLSFPSYSYLGGFSDGQMQGSSCVTNNSATMLVRVNATTIPLSVSQGGHVGYSEVREYTGDATTNNGYTVYSFTNTPDNQSIMFPFVPAQSYSYKNGLTLTQKVYTNAHKLIQETTNQYTYQNDAGFIIHGAKIAQLNNSGCTGCANRTFAYHLYTEPTERVLLQSATSKVYDVHADNYLETTSNFVYDANDQVIEKSQVLSNEPQRKKYTRYQYHSTFKTSPIEEYSYYSPNNTNHFEFTGGVSRSLLAPNKPTYVSLMETMPQVRTTNNPASLGLFKPRAQLSYDAKGNIISITKTGDPAVTSIIWDNAGIFPIAQVVNAPPTETAFTGFENSSNEGGWTFTLSTDADKKTGQRSHLLNQSVSRSGLTTSKKYLVTYWAKGGVPTINGVLESNDAPLADTDGWRYFEKIVTGISTVTISGTSSIKLDELRLYPWDAQMTSYSYDIQKGLISSTDVNNFTTFYSYTTRRQLEFVRDFENNILKKNEYRYARD